MTPEHMTPQQAKHLAILALYCHSLPTDYQHFDMAFYASVAGKGDQWNGLAQAIDPNICGTSACFAGHGPLAGIPPLPEERWDDYVGRCFLQAPERFRSAPSNPTLNPYFSWLFGPDWESSIPEAVKRAAHLLEHGKPPKFSEDDWWDDDKGAFGYVMVIHDKEAWEKFTPNLALLEQIVSGTGEQV